MCLFCVLSAAQECFKGFETCGYNLQEARECDPKSNPFENPGLFALCKHTQSCRVVLPTSLVFSSLPWGGFQLWEGVRCQYDQGGSFLVEHRLFLHHDIFYQITIPRVGGVNTQIWEDRGGHRAINFLGLQRYKGSWASWTQAGVWTGSYWSIPCSTGTVAHQWHPCILITFHWYNLFVTLSENLLCSNIWISNHLSNDQHTYLGRFSGQVKP